MKEKNNTTPINKIIPLSMVDGPGNRTAIFLQKCNLVCAYCHNPETQNMCNHCGICVEGCPTAALTISDENKVLWNEDLCISCDRCIKVCPYNASPKIKNMTAEEVFDEVKKNIPFIRGITVSGGECTLYPKFLTELFELAKKERLTCLIDFNGTIDLTLFDELITICDGVMIDVKSWDKELFRELTGGSNINIIKNLKYLAEKDKIEEIRIVCLENEVDAENIIDNLDKTIGEKAYKIKLKLIKFRKFGVRGRLSNYSSPSEEYMEKLKNQAIDKGYKNVIII
ncbi:MAG TPA: YjjW family glycine radical enzyme activase [Clostridiales bacterium]|nr:YjjW family glycine radical enzyme activase [Clostridiales bacterium]